MAAGVEYFLKRKREYAKIDRYLIRKEVSKFCSVRLTLVPVAIEALGTDLRASEKNLR